MRCYKPVHVGEMDPNSMLKIYPYTGPSYVRNIVGSFKRDFDFWYLTLSFSKVLEIELGTGHGDLGTNTTLNLVLLVVNVGYASSHAKMYFSAEFSRNSGT